MNTLIKFLFSMIATVMLVGLVGCETTEYSAKSKVSTFDNGVKTQSVADAFHTGTGEDATAVYTQVVTPAKKSNMIVVGEVTGDEIADHNAATLALAEANAKNQETVTTESHVVSGAGSGKAFVTGGLAGIAQGTGIAVGGALLRSAHAVTNVAGSTATAATGPVTATGTGTATSHSGP